eukprot:COSAG05_NODE_992_length_6265_cov_7.908693_2_plen_57_part_00
MRYAGTSTGISMRGVPRGWSFGSRTDTVHTVLRSVERYRLPREGALLFSMGIGRIS